MGAVQLLASLAVLAVFSAMAMRPHASAAWPTLAAAACLLGVERFFAPLSAAASAGDQLLGFVCVFGHTGALSAWRARRQGGVDAAALAWSAGAATGLAWGTDVVLARLAGDSAVGGSAGRWMPAAQGLLVAVPTLWLGAAFVGSLALVSPRAWSPWRPSFERQLAVRFLTSDDGGAVSKVTRVATLGVALGVWLVLVSIGILSGFEQDLFDKIVGVHGHLTLGRVDGDTLLSAAPLQRAVAQSGGGIVASASYVDAPLAVVSDINYGGAQLLGIDVAQSRAVLDALSSLPVGAEQGLYDEAPAVVLGAELARNLAVRTGDRVRLVVPTKETLTPVGPVPRMLSVRVAGTFSSKMYEVDSRTVVASLPVSRRLLGLGTEAVTGVHIKLRRSGDVDQVAARLMDDAALSAEANLGPVTAISFRARNQTLFAALALERVVASVVLAFVVMVASFSVVNTLTMAIWQRRYEVAILKAMGATDGSILTAFLWQGALVGATGTAIGTLLGIGTLAVLSQHGFGIPYEVYYVDALPVHISIADVLTCVLGSLLVLWTFALLPSQRGACLLPVEALRDG